MRLIHVVGENSVPIGIARIVHDVAGQPRMVQYVLAGEPQLRIGLQHVDDQIAHTVADVVPVRSGEVKVPVQYRIEQLLLLIVGRNEWWEAAQQNVEDNASGPNINLEEVKQKTKEVSI